MQAESLDRIAALFPGAPLFVKLAGSHSHNLNVEGSDYDYLGVYQAPLREVLSTQGARETTLHKSPDVEAHEVGKFCRLLLKGNSGMIEMLYTERGCRAFSPVWLELRANRARLVSKQVVHQYTGYARGQLQRLRSGTRLHTAGGEYNTKWAYHALRVARDAERIARGEPPTVWKDGQERELLLSIRRGDWSQEEVERELESRLRRVDNLAPWPLPDRGDEDWLNNWLYRLRVSELAGAVPYSR